jgi:predicted RNA-binding protein with PIN domain
VLWLIDGYNVIRRDPDLSGIDRRSLEAGRDALLRMVARTARGSGDDFCVVFDGVKSRRMMGGDRRVQVLFSRAPETADDVLIRLVRERGPGATVVTSDRTVGDAARRARATVVSADAFLGRVTRREPGVDTVDAVEDPDDEGPRAGPEPKKGNPRRRSKAERRSRRALGRLRPSDR